MKDLRDLVPKENTFSVIIPTCHRRNLVERAIESVRRQTYPWFEILVVDDGSDDDTWDFLTKISKKDDRIKPIKHEKRMQRVVATNTGIKNATQDYLAFLDSDDEYVRTYLESMNWAIKEYPDYHCFHFGALVCGLRGYRIREPFDLSEENEFGEAMDRFKSGRIGMGSFVYKREIHNEIGLLPEGKDTSPYSFADAMKEKFPEFIEMYGPMYLKGGNTIGNPWGQDASLFYMVTRKYKSKILPFLTYCQFVRRSGFTTQDDDFRLNR